MTGKDSQFFRTWNSRRAVLAVLVCMAMLASPAASWAQAAPAKSALTLNIVIVEGEGAVNNIRQRVAREPIVRVEDENHKPIAGATVVFLLPGDGASGSFPGNQSMVTVQTNQNGEAVGRGGRPNNGFLPGRYRLGGDQPDECPCRRGSGGRWSGCGSGDNRGHLRQGTGNPRHCRGGRRWRRCVCRHAG